MVHFFHFSVFLSENTFWIDYFLFFWRYSLFGFGRLQLFNLEAFPFTYGQYVVIKLADKLYNSVNACFCVSPWIFIQINNFVQVAGAGDGTTEPWITKPVLYFYTHLVEIIWGIFSG